MSLNLILQAVLHRLFDHLKQEGISLKSLQDVDKVNRLSDPEKRCKTRKRGLQKRAHTRTYVTDFAARVDAVSRNFHFVRSISENFCGCGVCQRSEGISLKSLPVFAFVLCFLFELILAFAAGYGNLAHLTGQAQARAALRAFEVFVLLHVLQAIHQLL